MTVAEIVRAKEEELRSLRDKETAFVVDRSGAIVLEKSGTGNRITFTSEDMERMKAAEGAIFTHNHSGGWKYPPDNPRHQGQTFSFSDVKLAMEIQLAELRAVGPIFRFALKPPMAGWGNLRWEDVEAVYLEFEQEVSKELVQEVRAGRLDFDEANYIADHEVWKRVAQYFGMRYTRAEE